jgi:diketogulonate reductase-like aldo/keto reductase
MRYAFDRGVRFFDLADQYGSHPFFARALKDGIPREEIVINTKIWVAGSKEQDAKRTLDRFRRELDTDYLDAVLLHCILDDDWPQRLRRWMDGLQDAKEKKIIGAHGVSCHSVGALNAAAKEPWVDYIQARINHLGIRMDAPPEVVVPVLKRAHASGKGIGGMKILGEGEVSHRGEESLRFVLGLGCVDTLVIGFESKEEIDEIEEKITSLFRQGSP